MLSMQKPAVAEEPRTGRSGSTGTSIGVTILAVLAAAGHLAAAATYPLDPNEYYFLDLSRHLDWGYLDVAPLGPLLWHLGDWAGGGSLIGLRFFSAVSAFVTVWVTGRMAWRLGGGPYAQLLAGACTAMAVWFMRSFGAMSLYAYEPFFWVIAADLLLLILLEDRYRLWPALGAVFGLGILLKPTILLFVIGAAIGVLTCARSHLRRLEPWLGMLLMFAIVSPFVIWMGRHDWVSVTFGKSRQLPMSPVMVVLTQILWLLPTTLPVWVIGLVELLRARPRPQLRALGVAYLSAALLLAAAHGKNYYLIPLHPVLFAAGGVAIERWRPRWARALQLALVLVAGMFWMPVSLPILDIPTFDRYTKIAWPPLGPQKVGSSRGMYNARQLTYQTRFGWPETAAIVARLYRGLPDAERANAVILTQRYWTAGPLNDYLPALGAPRAISGDVQYWLWGPGERRGDTALLIGFQEEDALRLYAEVQKVEEKLVTSPEEETVTVLVCRQPRSPLAVVWPNLRSLGEVVLPDGTIAPYR